MTWFTIGPTKIDKAIAGAVAQNTNPKIERIAESLTWGADEKPLLIAAATLWLILQRKSQRQRRFASHLLLTTIVAGALPHLFKWTINQERPDRCTVIGHWHGVPLSGKPEDAFPSGHAVHMGAIASAATLLPVRLRLVVWSVTTLLASTRIILLAHWTSDVIAGMALGATVERLIRKMTLRSDRRSKPDG